MSAIAILLPSEERGIHRMYAIRIDRAVDGNSVTAVTLSKEWSEPFSLLVGALAPLFFLFSGRNDCMLVLLLTNQ